MQPVPEEYEPLEFVGFTDRGIWSSTETYIENDIVHKDNTAWRCLTDDTIGTVPSQESEHWEIFISATNDSSGITTTDTEGLVGPAGEKVSNQDLIDAIAEKVAKQLVTNTSLTNTLAGYITKEMMSGVQTDDPDKVPTSALAYAMQQSINSLNANISSHNHDGRYYTESEVNSLLAGKAGTSHSHDWSSITGKPSVYAPADHNHDNQYYNKTETARLHSWKPVGSFTGNSALKIPLLTGLHEFMVGWRYNDDIPWLYTIFPSDGSRALGSYYYSEKYFGCAGFLIENGSVFKLNQSWCTAKSGSVTYSADNIQVYVYCR